MVTTKFHGKFMYYENVNGKVKKVEKEFKDPKAYSTFVNKYPMPTLASLWGFDAPRLATAKIKVLPKKKIVKAVKRVKTVKKGKKK